MEMYEIIEQTEENIRQALRDYREHTDWTDVLDDVSDEFITKLAHDSAYAKQRLRELFSKSPVWDERIDALVINGTRTHNPDYNRIRELAHKILWPVMTQSDQHTYDMICLVIDFFAIPEETKSDVCIDAINEIAPKAYAPNKKLSRIFKSICDTLGVTDESAGSEFQRLFAQFADELSAKKINFKLYVSINPAHFLTMSNPKSDARGVMLTSCHSLNSTEYGYNCGCSGYARDEVSFIVFTAADPKNPETLNNRKTTRQVFAYDPGNGLLMQSRMYNTSGGTTGAQEESKLYRDLVQREISMLEGVPNLWKTYPYVGGHEHCIYKGHGFGGYPDWIYSDYDAKISIRSDHAEDFEPLEVGTYGLCISCGCEIDSGLYCGDCRGQYTCDDCGDNCSETHTVYGDNGLERQVCEYCRDEYYTYCDECEEYHPNNCVTHIDGFAVCDDCRYEYYEECAECGIYHCRSSMIAVYDGNGDEAYVCNDCLDKQYCLCDECREYHHIGNICSVFKADGELVQVCEDCCNKHYSECPTCCKWVRIDESGICPICGAVIEEERNNAI